MQEFYVTNTVHLFVNILNIQTRSFELSDFELKKYDRPSCNNSAFCSKHEVQHAAWNANISD
jgi:hypothetical protein